jgi:hypothetical protein
MVHQDEINREDINIVKNQKKLLRKHLSIQQI